MARSSLALCFTLLTLLISFQLSTSEYPPESPPAPSPESDSPTPSSPSPSPSPDISSPPAPPPLFDSPSPAPTPSDGDEDDSPTPAPESDGPDADVPEPGSDEWTDDVKNRAKQGEKSGGDEEGMSGGKKAGIVIGAFGFVGLAALGGLVYKKRRENVRRAAYGDAVRREFL